MLESVLVTNQYLAMRINFLLKETTEAFDGARITDKHPPITSQMRYPLRPSPFAIEL